MSPLDSILSSVEDFLQRDVPATDRRMTGLQRAFVSAFPFVGPGGALLFREYSLEPSRITPETCRRTATSYVGALKLTLQLVTGTRAAPAFADATEAKLAAAAFADSKDIPARDVYADWLEGAGRHDDAKQARAGEAMLRGFSITDIKEQEIYFGIVPLPALDGSFVIDGVVHTLVPRIQDGVVVMPGDWLALAVTRGLEKIRPRIEKYLGQGDLDTLMPHDLIDARSVDRELFGVFRKSVSGHATKGTSLLAHVERLCTVQPENPREKATRSVLESLVPFPDDKSRVAGARALRKALLLREPSPPRVMTGNEPAVAQAGIWQRAVTAGRIERIDETSSMLWPDDPAFDPNLATALLIEHDTSGRAQLPDLGVLQVADGDHVEAGAPLVADPRVVDGVLAFGRDARIAVGDQRRDATISRSFAGLMSVRDVVELEVTVSTTKSGKQVCSPDVTANAELDESGIVRVGAIVKPGDALVGVISPDGTDISLRAPDGPAWTVLGVSTFWRKGSDLDAHDEREIERRRLRWVALAAAAKRRGGALGEEVESFATARSRALGRGSELAPGVNRLVRVVLARELPVSIGDKVADRHGFTFEIGDIVESLPGEVDLILPDAKTPAGTREEAAGGTLYLVRQ